jgi:DNA repair protein RadC
LASENEVDRMKDHFWILGLNTRNFIQYIDLVSLGTLGASLAHPREVFRFAIMKAISSLVMAHNLCGVPHKLCNVKLPVM